ncbi:hypothetical protein ACJ72_04697, partial [Emergomyces africanus]
YPIDDKYHTEKYPIDDKYHTEKYPIDDKYPTDRYPTDKYPTETYHTKYPTETYHTKYPTETYHAGYPTKTHDRGKWHTAKPEPAPVCRTCNPVSGENHCDPSTSCINTGKRFHCACRAGFKASKDNNNIHKQFRLPFKNFEFLVFTPEYTECNIPCNNNMKPANDLCHEVPLYEHCKA